MFFVPRTYATSSAKFNLKDDLHEEQTHSLATAGVPLGLARLQHRVCCVCPRRSEMFSLLTLFLGDNPFNVSFILLPSQHHHIDASPKTISPASAVQPSCFTVAGYINVA